MNPWAQRLLDFLERERRVFLSGSRDVVATTRQSFFSLEGRAGAVFFAALYVLSFLQYPTPAPYPFDPGAAFHRLAAAAAAGLWFFHGVIFALHLVMGAVLGIILRNAWDLAEAHLPIPSRRAWPRRHRWSITASLLIFVHGGVLLSALRARPAMYAPAFRDAGGPLRWFQEWLASGWLSPLGWLWTLAAALIVLAGAVHMFRRFMAWFREFPLPTRVASGVIGAGALFFLLGLWGVFRFHRPGNEGPNLLVLSLEGLRTNDLRNGERAPVINGLAHRGRTFAACVPAVPAREPALMTLLTGRSALSHGVRHAFPAAGDALLGVDSLPVQLRRAGYETAVITDDGGDFLGRLAPAFDQVRAPDLSVSGLRRRDALRRAVHLLPYLRGGWAQRWLPALRAVPGAVTAPSLGQETVGLLQQLRFEKRFFLLVHLSRFPALEGADAVIGDLLNSLDDLGLDDTTWVVLWSPYARPAEGASNRSTDVASPDRFAAPLAISGPLRHMTASRWVQTPVRDVDAAPTLLSAVGLSQPAAMEGLPLLDLDMDLPDFADRGAYTETDLWLSPGENPLPEDVRLSYGPPSAWLEEDPEAPGRLRIRPSVEDAVLAYRHRLLQTGRERLVYRPSRDGVVFEMYDLSTDPGAAVDLARTRAGADRVKDLKDILFQELRREPGWRPQNDFWIPEAFMKEKE